MSPEPSPSIVARPTGADVDAMAALTASLTSPEPGAGPRVGAELDALLFDAGGVIVVPDPNAMGLALVGAGARTDVATLVRAHYAGMRAHAGSTGGGEDTWSAYLHAYLAAAGVPPEHEAQGRQAFLRTFGHRTWRFPLVETITAMERLHTAGIPLGVVSNASGQIEGMLANLSACQVGPGGGVPVEVVVDSAVVGVEKPDPRIFTPALEVMAARGVAADRIGYVGDSLRYDIAGARAAGLVPLLLDPDDLYGGVDLGPGAHRIGSVHDLLPPPERPERQPEGQTEPEAD